MLVTAVCLLTLLCHKHCVVGVLLPFITLPSYLGVRATLLSNAGVLTSGMICPCFHQGWPWILLVPT